MRHRGFTLIELLVVIAIIGILSSTVLVSLNSAREKAYQARSQTELREIDTALELLAADNNGTYPADVSRGLPNGIEKFLPSNLWPAGPWPDSVYDWDSWSPSNLSFAPKQQVYQISIRFCPEGGPLSACSFPNLPWVTSAWGVDSAAYYCISGPCRAHASQPMNYPAYCMGGSCP